jgi:23S rRNA (guanosine2251-2'-O)-methyltransferase
MKNSKKELVLVLPDIRSAENVGAMFRTADAAGVSKIYLAGYTPCPLDRFGRPRKDIAKAALGAETWIEWEYAKSTSVLINKLKREGYTILGLEQDKNSINYKKYSCPKRCALIVGNEVLGLDKKIKSACDALIEIPMHGKKESLNVSVATGIALYQLLG